MATTVTQEVVQPAVTADAVDAAAAAAAPNLAPPLLPTEQIGPKGWVRSLYAFELPEDYNKDQVADLVRSAYRAMKNRTPVAGCEAVPMAGGPKDGMMQLRHYGDEIDDFAVVDHRDDAEFPSFADLKAKGFPVAGLHPDKVCKRGLGGEWPQAGDRLNVTMMQANFIRGGLLLNLSVMHAYADCTSVFKFVDVMAEEARKLQGIEISQPVDVPWEDREKVMEATGARKGLDEDHSEYVELPFTPAGPPPKLSSDIFHGHVFYFSPASLEALKKETAPENAQLLKGGENPAFVSTNDAITALIWQRTMAAQHHDLAEADSTPSVVGVALDARRRSTVPMHKHTIGNILGFTPAPLDLYSVIHHANLADLALIIRKAVAQSEGSYLDSLTARISRLGDVSRLVPTVFLDMPGNHMISSSWREFPFYDLQWGPALGGSMQALRPASVGITHSMQVLLPDSPLTEKGGVEVFVGVENSAMERFLSDPVWNKYAQKPQGL